MGPEGSGLQVSVGSEAEGPRVNHIDGGKPAVWIGGWAPFTPKIKEDHRYPPPGESGRGEAGLSGAWANVKGAKMACSGHEKVIGGLTSCMTLCAARGWSF